MVNVVHNYYKTLQVDPEAGEEVITAAYKRLMVKYQADVSASSEVIAHINECNAAYETLRDPVKRTQYDLSISGNACGGMHRISQFKIPRAQYLQSVTATFTLFETFFVMASRYEETHWITRKSWCDPTGKELFATEGIQLFNKIWMAPDSSKFMIAIDQSGYVYREDQITVKVIFRNTRDIGTLNQWGADSEFSKTYFSEDVRWAVSVCTDSRPNKVYLWNTDQGDLKQMLTLTEERSFKGFSHDGESLLIQDDIKGRLDFHSINTGRIGRSVEYKDVWFKAMSPDGKKIASDVRGHGINYPGLAIVDISGTTSSKVIPCRPGYCAEMKWLNNDTILYQYQNLRPDPSGHLTSALVLMNASDGQEIASIEGVWTDYCMVISHDKRRVICGGHQSDSLDIIQLPVLN